MICGDRPTISHQTARKLESKSPCPRVNQANILGFIFSYINFAFGDESLPTVYGGNVARLQAIKARYDPFGHFNQWFPL